jgi:hypothetical protein
MRCTRCRKPFEAAASRCPHCGAGNQRSSGLFQTSTVLISVRGTETVYRSVDEVPAPLRTRLLKSTNGANSGTVLIADRRGRKEIAKAMRQHPASGKRRWMHSRLQAAIERPAPAWLTKSRKRVIAAAIVLVTLTLIAAVFTYR